MSKDTYFKHIERIEQEFINDIDELFVPVEKALFGMTRSLQTVLMLACEDEDIDYKEYTEISYMVSTSRKKGRAILETSKEDEARRYDN